MSSEPQAYPPQPLRTTHHAWARSLWSNIGQKSILSAVIQRVDWRSTFAFFIPFLVYLRTLAPTIYNLDSAELTTAAFTGGLMRATGYPLYLSIGYLWSRLAAGRCRLPDELVLCRVRGADDLAG